MKRIREQLQTSHHSLFHHEDRRRLLDVIRRFFPKMTTAYVIHWIPEQREDIYQVLINDELITEIELDRYQVDLEPIIQTTSIQDYAAGHSKQQRLKLQIALGLAKNDLQNDGSSD